ncbi:MAG: NAD(P)-binding domain-containing protein [Sneathiella sp.]
MGSLDGTAVGFIGLDGSGKPLAARAKAAGATIYAYNKSPAIRYEIARAGIALCQSPAEIAEKAAGGAIILLVSRSDDPEINDDNEVDLADHLTSGTLIINSDGTETHGFHSLAARAKEKGVHWINVPLLDNEQALTEGSFELKASATEDDFKRALPVLNCLSSNITHMAEN